MIEKAYISTQQLSTIDINQQCVAKKDKFKKTFPRNSFRRVQPQDHKKKNIKNQSQTPVRNYCKQLTKNTMMQSIKKQNKGDKLLFKKQNKVEYNIKTHQHYQKFNNQKYLKNTLPTISSINTTMRNTKNTQKYSLAFPRYTQKTKPSNFYNDNSIDYSPNKIQITKGLNVFSQESFNKQKLNKKNKQYFIPKNFAYFTHKFKKPQEMSGEQIPQVIQKHSISRYDLKQLQGMHRAMLQYSQGKTKLLQKSFLVVLNMQGIVIDENKLNLLREELANLHEFQQFLKVYKKVQNDYFKQSIIDYMEILFKREDTQYLDIMYILQVFLKRMKQKDAYNLYELVVDKIKQKFGFYTDKVKLNQFYRLCYNDFNLCQKINENFVHKKQEE